MAISLLAVTAWSCASAPSTIPAITTPAQSKPATSQSTNAPSAPTRTQESPAGAVMSLSLSAQNIKPGETFTADVMLETKIAVRGAQWKLSFDPQKMRCDKVTEGNFFKDWAASHGGQTVMFPNPQIDNSTGQVSDTGIAIMSSQEGGASGRGILCIYSFTALKDGAGAPQLSNVQVVDSTAKNVTTIIKSQ